MECISEPRSPWRCLGRLKKPAAVAVAVTVLSVGRPITGRSQLSRLTLEDRTAGTLSVESTSGEGRESSNLLLEDSFCSNEPSSLCQAPADGPPEGAASEGNLETPATFESEERPTIQDVVEASFSGDNSTGMWSARSQLPQCQAARPADADFLERLRPCGELAAVCTDIPLVEANRDYPGGGIGAVVPGQDYLVQFDIGLHHEVAREILGSKFREIDTCLNCPRFEEQCFEMVVTGGDNWGNLGISELEPTAYNCMGGCGLGCKTPGSRKGDIGALDCLKHDLCSAWKSVKTGRATSGFCHDPDCGDEAAMAIFNCWRGFRLFGSVGGNSPGPFSNPAVCDKNDKSIRGCWSHSGWFTQGRCKVFQGWAKGQGIPDPHPMRSPIQRL